jgi:hypothetical protein
MNDQINLKKILTIFLIIVFMLVIFSLIPRGESGEFELTSTNPGNRARAVDYEIDAIKFNFNQDIDPSFDKSSVVISPNTEVDVVIESSSIVILPREDLRPNKPYTVGISSVKSTNGQTIEDLEVVFTTMVDTTYQGQLRSKAPEYYEGFSITYIEDMDAYVITISELPIEENEKLARDILKQQNVTDENNKIIIDISRGLMNSGSPSDPPLPEPEVQLR